jgi:hypothetical protein
MSIKLTIKERYELLHHVGRIPCTLQLRYSIDALQKQIEFTNEEITSKEIKVDPTTYHISSNDDSYEIELNSIPEGVARSIATWVTKYDVNEMKDNGLVQDALGIFKKVISV